MKTVKRAWLHFVGKSYYSIKDFCKEADKIGVSRAIAPKILKKMQLGDLIVLAQKDSKHIKIFGTFVFSELIGLNHEIINKMINMKLIVESKKGIAPLRVERGCGSYVVTGICEITNPEQVMKLIKETEDKELGRMMIGGKFKRLELPLDHVIVKIPFRQGFRRFDWDTFIKEVTTKLVIKRPNINHVKVDGFFYVFDSEKEPVEEISFYYDDPKLLKIENYQLN